MIHKLSALITCTILMFGVAAMQTALAQIPRTITYQGMINDGSGNPMTGEHVFTFRIYDSPQGGNILHQESLTLQVTDGLFSTSLGVSQPIAPTMKFDTPYYLGISVDGNSEMIPRTTLSSAPYALNSASAKQAEELTPDAPNVVRSINGQSGTLTLAEGIGISIDVSNDGDTFTLSTEAGGGTVTEITNTDGGLTLTDATGPVVDIALADGGIALSKLDVSSAEEDQVLTYDGTDLVFADLPAGGGEEFALPFGDTVESDNAFLVSNTGEGSAGVFHVDNEEGTAHTLVGLSNTESVWDGPAAVFGDHTGNGGIGVFGRATGGMNAVTPPRGVYGVSDSGAGVYGYSDEIGTGIIGHVDGSGEGVLGLSLGTGRAGHFLIANADNTSDALHAETNGSGSAMYGLTTGVGAAGEFVVDNVLSPADAFRIITDAQGTGLYLRATGSGIGSEIILDNPSSTSVALSVDNNGMGAAIHGHNTNADGVTPAVFGETSSTLDGSNLIVGATGVTGLVASTSAGEWSAGMRGINMGAAANSIGVVGYQDAGGWGVVGMSVSGTGVRAEVNDDGNALVAVYNGTTASTTAADNIAIFQAQPPGGGAIVNQARIDNAGTGYFNGGTQSAGADVAEMFDVEGMRAGYEPGDVLAISTSSDRTVEMSQEPYSTLVVGVYATKPGVVLSELHIDADHSMMVPMGIVGVIPTKVSDENGPIRRGDILVTASKPGHAMKADPAKAAKRPGSVIGKALENFTEDGTGMIRVLVNVR